MTIWKLLFQFLPDFSIHQWRRHAGLFLKGYRRLLVFLVSLFAIKYFFIVYSVLVNQKYSHRSICGSRINFYSSFLDEHLNLFKWATNFILSGSKFIVQLWGYTARLTQYGHIQINHGHQVNLRWVCLGLGFMGFWMAFVISNKGHWIYKLCWLVAGISFLLFINMCRIALILIANEERFVHKLPIDHHTLFNIVSYVVLLLFLLAYLRSVRVVENGPSRVQA